MEFALIAIGVLLLLASGLGYWGALTGLRQARGKSSWIDKFFLGQPRG